MANIYSNPTYRAKKGYNGFDMSQLLKFTSTTGELLPVYYDFLQPGDKVSLNSILKTRTLPLQTAAMCNIKERIEWFFVPMNQLYSLFEDWYFGINDNKTSLVNPDNFASNPGDMVPYIDYVTLWDSFDMLKDSEDHYFYPDLFPAGTIPEIVGTHVRLMELLGVPISQMTSSNVMSISPWLPCAYQKIYMDYYRLSDREASDARCFNVDKYYSAPLISVDDANRMFTLRYRPREKDFFTANYTSPLMGSASIGSFGYDMASQFNQWLASGLVLQTSSSSGTTVSNNLYPTAERAEPTQVSSKVPFDGVGTHSAVNYNNLSPVQIRTSFAVEKLLEITRRAGKHFDKQMLAHFGIEPPAGLAGEVMFLGKQESEIVIGDVISTAETADASLGKIAGRGYNYGKGGKDIKFTADCHGILMAIYSAEPVSDYPQFGLDRLNTLVKRADYFTPAFDDLGMQPLFMYQNQLQDRTSNSSVIGWQYRYWELKNKYNRVCGALQSERSMSDWTTQYYWNIKYLCDYLVSPFSLNDIMLVSYAFNAGVEHPNSTWFDTDPLMHELYFDVKKSSKMSAFGLPSL